MNDAVVVGGGQSGLVAARALRGAGLTPIVLEEQALSRWAHGRTTTTASGCSRPPPTAASPASPSRATRSATRRVPRWSTTCRAYAATLDVDIRTEVPGQRGRVHRQPRLPGPDRHRRTHPHDGGDRRQRVVRSALSTAPAGSAHLHRHPPARGRLPRAVAVRRPAHRGRRRRRLSGSGRRRAGRGGHGHPGDSSSPRLPSPTGRRARPALLARADRLRRPSPRMARSAPPGTLSRTPAATAPWSNRPADLRPLPSALDHEHVRWPD